MIEVDQRLCKALGQGRIERQTAAVGAVLQMGCDAHASELDRHEHWVRAVSGRSRLILQTKKPAPAGAGAGGASAGLTDTTSRSS
jgi:hypothetical protein